MQGVFSWSVISHKFSLWNVIYILLSSWTVKEYMLVMRYFTYIFFVICDCDHLFLVKLIKRVVKFEPLNFSKLSGLLRNDFGDFVLVGTA